MEPKDKGRVASALQRNEFGGSRLRLMVGLPPAEKYGERNCVERVLEVKPIVDSA